MSESDQKPGLLQRISNGVDRGLSNFYAFEGALIGRFPLYTVLFCLVLAGLCSIGFINFEQQLDGDKLWTPSNQPSFKDKEYVESLYPDEDELVKLICISSDDNQPNILTKNSLQELQRLWSEVDGMRAEYKGVSYTFPQICARSTPQDPCKIESILDVWNYDPALLAASTNVITDINSDGNVDSYNRSLNYNYVMGGLERGANGEIAGAEVFQVAMNLEVTTDCIGGETYDPVNREWIDNLIDLVIDDFQYTYLDCYVSALSAVDQVSNEAIASDVALLTIGYVLIIMYTLVVLFRNSPVYCKSQIAIFSILAIGLAIASSFGLASAFGVKFNLVVQTLPFLLLGLGVDDSFVIMGAYFKETAKDQPLVQRMSNTMRAAGTSITVTSVTDLVAFAIGTWTDLPALRDFSIFAALGILFVFIYQAVFFVAIVVLDARREDRAKQGAKYFGFGAIPPQDASVQMTEVSNKGGTDEENGQQKQQYQDTSVQNRKCCGSGEFDIQQPTLITKVIGEYLPKFTLSYVGIVIILILEVGLIAWGIVGATQVYMDFRFRDWFVPDGNWLKDSFNVENRYFSGESYPFYVYTKNGDYFSDQNQLNVLTQNLENDRYVTSTPPVDSWYIEYSIWATQNNIVLNSSSAEFVSGLNTFLTTDGKFYADDVIFNSDKTVIISSRTQAFTVDIEDGSFAVSALDSFRETSEDSAPSFSPIPYSEVFLFWDGFRVIASQTVRNVIVAGVAVFIVTLFLLANVVASLIVLLMVVLTDVCLFGFMWYADLTFNTVTAINMVLAVGLAVDYSAHIAHSFLVVKGTRRERAQKALFEIGGEVFSGGFTTFLGVVIMGAAQHYIFQTFFKMFFALIVLGLWHGIIILPIVLRLIGPAAYDNHS